MANEAPGKMLTERMRDKEKRRGKKSRLAVSLIAQERDH